MRKLLTRFLTTLLLLSSFAIYFPSNIYAANSCDATLSSVEINPGGTVTVTFSSVVLNDQPVDNDENYFIKLHPSGRNLYDSQATMRDVENGTVSFTINYDDFPNPELSYKIELRRDLAFSSTSMCETAESVYVASADSTSCEDYTFSPTSGEAGTEFTLTATGCVLNTVYRLSMAIEEDFSNPISTSAEYSQPGAFTMTISPPTPGIYRVQFGDNTNTFAVYFEQGGIEVTEPSEDIVYTCGSTGLPDYTPDCNGSNTTNCCPSQCSWDIIDEPGTGNDLSMCVCGVAGAACCPGNTCQYEMNDNVFCNSSGRCEAADFNDPVRQCGDVVRSDAVCDVRCPLQEIDAGINLYWCACGADGGACCETGAACQGDGFVCTEGTCLLPEYEEAGNVPIRCTSGVDGFDTALGCFNYTDITQGTLTIIRFFIGVGGGVTLLLIAYAAFLIMVSAGNPKMLQRGREVLTSAILGLIMFALSALILRVIGIDLLGLF